MAFTGTFTTEAIINSKAGAGKSASVDDAMESGWAIECEHYINAICGYDFTTNYASLKANAKQLLSDAVSSFCAIHAIFYDTTGYDSILEAQSKIIILKQLYSEAINALLDASVADFIKA